MFPTGYSHGKYAGLLLSCKLAGLLLSCKHAGLLLSCKYAGLLLSCKLCLSLLYSEPTCGWPKISRVNSAGMVWYGSVLGSAAVLLRTLSSTAALPRTVVLIFALFRTHVRMRLAKDKQSLQALSSTIDWQSLTFSRGSLHTKYQHTTIDWPAYHPRARLPH